MRLMFCQGFTTPDVYLHGDDKQEDDDNREQLIDQVRVAMDRLPEIQRRILMLRHDHNLSFAEIGQVMDVPKMRAFRIHRAALESIRTALSPESAGPHISPD